MRQHWTNAALLSAGLYLGAFTGQAQAQASHYCRIWNTVYFFQLATALDIMRCLEQGADIEARDKKNMTPLHIAGIWGTAQQVNALLKAGASVDARDEKNMTPLHIAVAA